ncbi:MAG: TIGR03790 family protein [Gammaproteobacteria bacterium]|nr:TIGR03790 family protein [Gammaproteobacteria bacterium]NND38843.1 TIGR03790 family protein [Pseudomonadales bacterium]RZV54468.1 MAG: TIGR03790 family protein [Pseudomonadales bacterium]
MSVSLRLVSLLLGFLPAFCAASMMPAIELPVSGISASQLAVVYLQADPQSEKIARYYAAKRDIPEKNIISIALRAENGVVQPARFAVQKKLLDARLGQNIQAYALAWTSPYRVGCMGITAAFAFGFDTAYCSNGCKRTRSSPYYNSGSTRPYHDFSVRPAMLLAGESFDEVAALIDRGISADDSQPRGAVYLLQTSDAARSVRKILFPAIAQSFRKWHRVHLLKQDTLQNTSDILFYFTGLANVQGLDSLHFFPGAMADHLTSYGGQLPHSSQMSALAWLQAGATGSYGTALEPCAFVQKFPNPYLAIWHYRSGASLLEAYWKSVQMPGQGNFIGEPLAAPFRGYRLRMQDRKLFIESPVFFTGRYRVYALDAGLPRVAGDFRLRAGEKSIALEPPFSAAYRVERLRD